MNTSAGLAVRPAAVAGRRPRARTVERLAASLGAGLFLLGSSWLAASAGRGLTARAGDYAIAGKLLTGPLGGVRPLVPAATAARVDWALAAITLGAIVLYAAAPALQARALLVVLGCGVLLFTVCGPLLSSDVFGYADYARLAAVHHLNPYVTPPSGQPGDPVYPLVFWSHQTSPYGPLFTLITLPLALGPAVSTIWMLKLLAGLAALSSIVLVGRAAERLGGSAARARVFVGANPILLIWGVGGGHNDLIVMALVSTGVLLAAGGRPTRSGAAFAVAVGLKVTGGLALPFLLLASPGRRRIALGFAAVSLPVWALALGLFGPHLLDQVIAIATQPVYAAPRSLPDVLSTSSHGGPGGWLAAAFGLGLLGALGAAVFGLVRRRLDWPSAAGWVAVAALVCLPTTQLWYLTWVLPLAAVARSPLLRLAVVAVCAVMVAVNLAPVTQ